MISDERLSEAAREAEKELLSALPEPEECEAQFSPAFRRRMKRLVSRTDHPIRYWSWRAVACILLVILLGAGSVLAFSTDARAAFTKWVRDIFGENGVLYTYGGEDRELPESVYYPAWIPDGYCESNRFMAYTYAVIIYTNSEEGCLLSFSYSTSANVYVETRETDIQTVHVGDAVADLYLDRREGNANTLVWSDEEKGVIFLISAHCSGEEMIKIAESITDEDRIPE